MSEPLLIKTCTGTERYYGVRKKSLTYEHSLVIVAGFLLLFSTLLTLSTASRAQLSASVSASVPETPYNTKKRSPGWWETIDPYTKLMVQSGSALVFVTFIALMLQLQHARVVRHKLLSVQV